MRRFLRLSWNLLAPFSLGGRFASTLITACLKSETLDLPNAAGNKKRFRVELETVNFLRALLKDPFSPFGACTAPGLRRSSGGLAPNGWFALWRPAVAARGGGRTSTLVLFSTFALSRPAPPHAAVPSLEFVGPRPCMILSKPRTTEAKGHLPMPFRFEACG